jgi:succinyl-diaminopimelate desuccinylase
VGDKASIPTRPDAEVATRLARSLKKLRRISPVHVGIGGQTAAAFPRARGIPAVVWGTILHNAHAPNEKSSIINTIADAKVMLDMLFD